MRNVYLFATLLALAFGQTFADEVDRVGPTPGDDPQPVVYNLGIEDDAEVTKPLEVEAPEGKADKIVVVGATWCGPCQSLKLTVLPSLKAQQYNVEYIDAEKEVEKLRTKYSNIKPGSGNELNLYRSYPTIFYIRGDKIIKKETGYKSALHIRKTLWKPEQAPVVEAVDELRNKLPWNK